MEKFGKSNRNRGWRPAARSKSTIVSLAEGRTGIPIQIGKDFRREKLLERRSYVQLEGEERVHLLHS